MTEGQDDYGSHDWLDRDCLAEIPEELADIHVEADLEQERLTSRHRLTVLDAAALERIQSFAARTYQTVRELRSQSTD